MDEIEILDPNSEIAEVLRCSTPNQRIDGDSPEIQRNKIRFKVSKVGKNVGLSIELAAPASGELDTQPLINALPFLKQYPIIKEVWVSIPNRATRAKTEDFLQVLRAYAKAGLTIIDTEGKLASQPMDSLEEFEVDYKFNKYDANEGKILDAIVGARTNWRETLTQLLSAEIRFARMGYWTLGKYPMGYEKVRKQTEHGRRLILEPDEGSKECRWIREMLSLACKKVPRNEIVRIVNEMGYRTKKDKQLTIKQLDVYLQDPIYCLIRVGKTKKQQMLKCPVKIYGTPFLTIEQFNEINQGKKAIVIENGEIKILKGKPAERALKTKGDNFPFKKYVRCPKCRSNLLGSGAKSGKYPQYHCHKGHSYWYVHQADFDNTILEYTQGLKLTKEKIAQYKKHLLSKVTDKLVTIQGIAVDYQARVTMLEQKSLLIRRKQKMTDDLMLFSELDEELKKVEADKELAIIERDKTESKQIDIQMVVDRVTYFLEHLDKGLLGIANPTLRAACWATIFDEPPTYDEIVSRTARLRPHIEQIATNEDPESSSVGTKRFELLTLSV